VQVNEFQSKVDLIEAMMASAHVPFALDGRPFLRFRGKRCWDGSFPDFIYANNSHLIKRDGKALVVDYAMDDELGWKRGDFLKLRSYDEIMGLIDKGYSWAERQLEIDSLAHQFDLAACVLDAER
jgi:hypothetical protein